MDHTDIINYDDTINKLNDKVNKFTSTDINISDTKQSILKILKYPFIYYTVIPFIILIVLWFLKPSIIIEEININEDSVKKKINYKKLLLMTIIITLIIFLVYFSYIYEKK
jgi:Na+/H+ antiporter NhaC